MVADHQVGPRFASRAVGEHLDRDRAVGRGAADLIRRAFALVELDPHVDVEDNGSAIRDAEDVGELERRVTDLCEPLKDKVEAIVNYDRTVIYPEIEDAYAQMVAGLEARFYSHVTRYPGSAFMRMKLKSLLRY